MSIYASKADKVYTCLRDTVAVVGGFLSDESDEKLLFLAQEIADHPASDINEEEE